MKVSPSQIRKLLSYDPETGLLRWKQDRAVARKGDIAGVVSCKGYKQIRISGRTYRSGILAWVIVKGRWPKHQIDHKNLKRDDDRWENIREATPSQNSMNRGPRSDSFSGLKGVKPCANNKWMARISVGGQRLYLGYFGDKNLAALAYDAAAIKHFGPFARLNFPMVSE